MKPFVIHREAFESLEARDYVVAEARFVDALRAFAEWPEDSAARESLDELARSLPPGSAKSADVMTSLQASLPGWLCDLHFESFCLAYSRRDAALARLHWQTILAGAMISRLSAAFDVETLRQRAMQILQLTQPPQGASPAARRAFFQRAERLLRFDPDNIPLRTMLVEICVHALNDAALASRADRLKRKVKQGRVTREQARIRRRAVLRAPVMARRLRRHFARRSVARSLEPSVALAGYGALFIYYLDAAFLEDAKRALRGARRVDPGAAELRDWRKALQTAMRRR